MTPHELYFDLSYVFCSCTKWKEGEGDGKRGGKDNKNDVDGDSDDDEAGKKGNVLRIVKGEKERQEEERRSETGDDDV